jgi:hypothetical protein
MRSPPPRAAEGVAGDARDERSAADAADRTPVLSRPGVQVALNPERQEVTLRLRYTTAVVGTFALLVAVALAYIFGRGMAGGPAPVRAAAVSPSTADLRRGPVQPGALDVAGRGNRAGPVPAPRAPVPVPPVPTPGPVSAQESSAYFDAAVVNGTARRIANLNYAVILSFPPHLRDRAAAVRDFLNKNGVPCTLESVPKVAGDKVCVVGVRGFPVRYSRLPEYNEYIESIQALAEQLPGRPTPDRVRPTMFKWE